ncbi:hypothetical protein AB1Y20_009560 [Prymnesium parvum]|uniref:Uncharacterized protein n=1 Tax=Prymnesium parvum TaxID=97485 RepID=A0AB34K1U1_PRYPA|mmetsp:Transcript_45046/g.112083  ORF Transcript_45046/g.112083 Transcript_45046/m.112083 type:complete len:382 (-) Transcript_45046:359-1504(-)
MKSKHGKSGKPVFVDQPFDDITQIPSPSTSRRWGQDLQEKDVRAHTRATSLRIAIRLRKALQIVAMSRDKHKRGRLQFRSRTAHDLRAGHHKPHSVVRSFQKGKSHPNVQPPRRSQSAPFENSERTHTPSLGSCRDSYTASFPSAENSFSNLAYEEQLDIALVAAEQGNEAMLEWLEAQLMLDERLYDEQLDAALAAAEQGDVAMLEWLEAQLASSSSPSPAAHALKRTPHSAAGEAVRVELALEQRQGSTHVSVQAVPALLAEEERLRAVAAAAAAREAEAERKLREAEAEWQYTRARLVAAQQARDHWQALQGHVREWAAREVELAASAAQRAPPRVALFHGVGGEHYAASYVQAVWRGRQEREELWYIQTQGLSHWAG